MMSCVKRCLQKNEAIFQLLTISLGCHGLAILKFMPIQYSIDNRKPSIKARETLKVNNK